MNTTGPYIHIRRGRSFSIAVVQLIFGVAIAFDVACDAQTEAWQTNPLPEVKSVIDANNESFLQAVLSKDLGVKALT